ncbi:MAG: divalent-cation tolerance protein CutA [Puniceicoccales bacterium]|jgi:periplasmic divalent cation tolerance protein|nr:divalent-cation tolerance protein CutA [Puniceicoccales bacterium]
MQNDCVIVETTVDSIQLAESLAESMISKGLAACVQVQKVESFYRWENKIERVEEYLLSAKTMAILFRELEEFIEKNHSYDTPEILQIPIVGGSKRYLNWVQSAAMPPHK